MGSEKRLLFAPPKKRPSLFLIFPQNSTASNLFHRQPLIFMGISDKLHAYYFHVSLTWISAWMFLNFGLIFHHLITPYPSQNMFKVRFRARASLWQTLFGSNSNSFWKISS